MYVICQVSNWTTGRGVQGKAGAVSSLTITMRWRLITSYYRDNCLPARPRPAPLSRYSILFVIYQRGHVRKGRDDKILITETNEKSNDTIFYK